jgi:hypothetical protein
LTHYTSYGNLAPSYRVNLVSGAIPADWAFARNSTTWGFNSSGFLTSYSTNTPCFDYNPQTLAPRGLLIQETRIQRILNSRGFDQSGWTASNVTVSKNVTGLDGVANSAYTVTASAGNGTLLQPITITSAAYSGTVYLKRVTGTGTISITMDGGTTWLDVTSSLSSSVWNRVTKIQTLANPSFGIRISTSGDAVAIDQAQVEAGAYPTQPIVSTGTTVTRNADFMICSNISWMKSTEGSFFCEFERVPEASLGTGTGIIVEANDASFNNRMYMVHRQTDTRWAGTSNTVATGDTGFFPVVTNASTKIVGSYRWNHMATAASSTPYWAVATNSANATPASLTLLGMGCRPASSNSGDTFMNGWFKMFRYYNRVLSKNQMKELTR